MPTNIVIKFDEDKKPFGLKSRQPVDIAKFLAVGIPIIRNIFQQKSVNKTRKETRGP